MITFLAVWADCHKPKEAVKEYNIYSSMIKGKAYIVVIPLQSTRCSSTITI
jgi:hypothetical protein